MEMVLPRKVSQELEEDLGGIGAHFGRTVERVGSPRLPKMTFAMLKLIAKRQCHEK